jgi:hypothetical protein
MVLVSTGQFRTSTVITLKGTNEEKVSCNVYSPLTPTFLIYPTSSLSSSLLHSRGEEPADTV